MQTTRRSFLGYAALMAGVRPRQISGSVAPLDANYFFNGPIPEDVLHNYLSRTLSMRGFWEWVGSNGDTLSQYKDNLRMLGHLRPKHVTFVGDLWWDLNTTSYAVETIISGVTTIAADLHAIDSDLIVGAACFETIGPAANQVPIPGWVFDEMGLPSETRNFQWDRMTYPDFRISDGNSTTPAIDITQTESRLWYYYWARRYIEAGCEHLDMGEVNTISQGDLPAFSHCFDLVNRIRAYARSKARRGWILISGQVGVTDDQGKSSWNGQAGIVDPDGNLLLDYLYVTTRARENPASPQDCILAKYGDTAFSRTRGGISPSGWRCERTPYTLNLDPGANPKPGNPVGWPFQWGWCEPAWFASQPASYRADWLRYAAAWIAITDPYAFLAMTGQVGLNGGVQGIDWYHANAPWYNGPATGKQWFTGFGEEAVIAEIWAAVSDPVLLNGDFSRPVLSSSQLESVAPEIPSWTFGAPSPSYGQPTSTPLPSGQSPSSTSGIARKGSSYVGSATLDDGQQIAFLLGSGQISQAIQFPGKNSYTLKFRCAQRSALDKQEILVWFDNILFWRFQPPIAWTSCAINFDAANQGVHRIRISGNSQGTDTALLSNMTLSSAASQSAAPVIQAVVNAADGSAGTAPGSLISIYGTNPGVTESAASALPLPRVLGGVAVSVNGIAIPLTYASPSQINGQLPFEITPGPATLLLSVGSTSSQPVTINVRTAAPGIFTVGAKRALVINSDGQLNGPSTPAAPGSFVIFYVTGQGAVDFPVPTGSSAPVSPLSRPLGVCIATIDGAPAELPFLGLAPGFAGVCQGNLKIPSIAPGDHSLQVQVGDAVSAEALITTSEAGVK